MTEKKSNHLDFDQFIDETQKQGPTITIYGKEEQLAPSLPAFIMVTVVRMMKNKKTETQVEDLMEMAYALFGKERFMEWLAKGLSIEQLEALIRKTIDLYTGTPSVGGAKPRAARGASKKA